MDKDQCPFPLYNLLYKSTLLKFVAEIIRLSASENLMKMKVMHAFSSWNVGFMLVCVLRVSVLHILSG